MTVRVERFGHNFAIFFTQEQADELGLHEGMALDVQMVDGKLILTPSRRMFSWMMNHLVPNVLLQPSVQTVN